MAKFLKKYSLVLIISIIAGLIIGFRTFNSSDNQNNSVKPTPTPMPTLVLTPTLEPIPTLPVLPELTDEEIEELIDDIGIDPNASEEEKIQRILDYFEIEIRD
jgi:hypothetical protein